MSFTENADELSGITKLLKGDEVARILDVSKTFAYLLMRQGKIPTVRMGRCVRVREQDLQEFIDNRVKDSGGMG